MTHSEARKPGWEHFPHGADIGIRGFGHTIHEAFEQAAMALTGVITDPETISPTKPVHISCEGSDDELLFVDWLNALIYEMAKGKILFSQFTVNLDCHGLQATAWGEPVNQPKHQPTVEVKGATYTELHVGENERGEWIAQCVVDV